MRKRWFGFALWLLLACCLYFFENNTGTRAILLCSLLFPLIPPLRFLFFSPDDPENENAPKPLTVKTYVQQEAEDAGDVRPYAPGDPVRRIHWKLSAKKDELLVRDTAAERETLLEECAALSPMDSQKPFIAGKGTMGNVDKNSWALMVLTIFCCVRHIKPAIRSTTSPLYSPKSP